MPKGLTDKELENLAYISDKDFPSGSEVESDNDSDDSPLLILPEQGKFKLCIVASEAEDSDDSDDDNIPLINFVTSRNSEDNDPLVPNSPTASTSSGTPANQNQLDIFTLASEPNWDKSPRNTLPVPDFREQNGPAVHVMELEEKTPFEIFSMFFRPSLLEDICFQTNLLATQEGKPFKPTDVKEIKTFLGINIFMGMKRLPSYRDYWSTKPDFHDYYISSLMTVNRFGWLLSHVHFNDNSIQPKRGEPNYDKLFKLRPFLTEMSKCFMENYHARQKLVIDESMVKFKGRSSLKQFMRDKPIKRGFKIWMLCDSSGYNLKFDIYTGRGDDQSGKGLASRVVLNLVQNFTQKNHSLYIDNFFNGYELLLTLKNHKIFACGTVRPQRKYLPNLLDDKKLKRGEYDWKRSEDGITMFKWKDKKAVNFLSNFHDPNQTLTVQRKEKDGSISDIPCPQILSDYNSNMNFVDNFDRLKNDYQIDRKSKKWYLRLFFHFLDAAITNSFIIHKEVGSEKLTNKEFRRAVYEGLLAKSIVCPMDTTPGPKRKSVQVRSHKPFVSKNIRLESSRHQPIRSTSKRCAACSTKKVPIRTIWMCSTCNVPLCLRKGKDCFQNFHKK